MPRSRGVKTGRQAILTKWVGLALGAMALVVGAKALAPDRPAERPEADIGLARVTAFGPVDAVNDIDLDAANGVLWAATDGGVVRWVVGGGPPAVFTMADGLPGNTVRAVAVGPRGEVWAATAAGAARLRGLEPERPAETRWQRLWSWVGKSEQRGDDGRLVVEEIPYEIAWYSIVKDWDHVRDVAVAADGTAWFATASGLGMLTPERLWRGNTSLDGLPGSAVLRTAVDRQGGVWVLIDWDTAVTPPRPACIARRAPDGKWVVHEFASAPLLSHLLVVDASDRAWFVDPSTLTVRSMDALGAVRDGPGHAPFDRSVSDLAFAVDGRAWWIEAGSVYRQGSLEGDWEPLVSMLSNGQLSEHPPMFSNSLISGSVGDVWLGGQGGIRHWTPDGTWSALTAAPTQEGTIVGAVGDIVIGADDSVWFADSDSVRRLGRDGQWTVHNAAAGATGETPPATALAVDAKGGVWIGGQYGARRVGMDGTTRDYGVADGLTGAVVTAIGTDGRDGVWFATATGDLHDPETLKGAGVSRLAPDGTWTTFTAGDGLGWNDVRAIAADTRGDMWFATRAPAGLGARDAEDRLGRAGTGVSVRASDGSWRSYTGRDGLASNTVRAIAAAPDGSVWFATDAGASLRMPNGKWATFTMADGLPGDDVRAVALDAAGNAWFATYLAPGDEAWPPAALMENGSGNSDNPERRVLAVRTPGGLWRSFGTREGLTSHRLVALGIDGAGDLWIGTEDAGVVAMRPH